MCITCQSWGEEKGGEHTAFGQADMPLPIYRHIQQTQDSTEGMQ